jgi:hypothetical protein
MFSCEARARAIPGGALSAIVLVCRVFAQPSGGRAALTGEAARPLSGEVESCAEQPRQPTCERWSTASTGGR